MDLLDLGKLPIDPERPAGDDVRYDPLFDQLQAEVERSSLPSLAGAVDWEKVVGLSCEILSTKSKDLLVAGYLTVGLIHTRKVAGLAAGLRIYRDLVEQHGPNLFPQRQRARLLSIEWLKQRTESALSGLSGSAMEPADLRRMQEDMASLQEALAKLLPEAPSLHEVREFLDSVAIAPPPDAAHDFAATAGPILEQEVVGQSPAAPTTQPATQPIEPAPQPAQPMMQPVNQREAVDEVVSSLRQRAAFLRELDHQNPLSYRLTRQAAWLEIVEIPPTHSGRTLVPPPTDGVRQRLCTLIDHREWRPLLMEVEGLLHDHIFWLDLNRHTAYALSELGAGPAAAAVKLETSFLLQRAPGLDRLCFADGTPFADTATMEWLRQLAHARHAVSRDLAQAVAAAEPAGEMTMSEELEAATTLLRAGNLEDAVELLQEGLRRSLSERERFQWRLALSRLLVETENASLALPHLEQVVTDVERFRLDSYEPPLALEGLRLAWHAYQSQQDNASKEKAKETLHRIGRIDLAEMIRLTR